MGWSGQITKFSTYLLPILSDNISIMSMLYTCVPAVFRESG